MTYRSPTKAMKHQREALRRALSAPPTPAPDDVFAYLMDRGTGKTKVVLDEWGAGAASGGPQDLLVFAPTGSYRNWFEDKSDLQRSELNVHVDPEMRERMLVCHWQTGGGRGHREALRKFLAAQDPRRPRALFVNVEAMSTVEDAEKLCAEFVGQRLCYVAVDESTRIKGKSNRTKAVTRVAEDAAARRILTGLVTPRSPLDLFYQFAFLDWRIVGLRNYRNFVARYAIQQRMTVGGRSFDRVVGYRNTDELYDLIAPYSYRVLKKDCLDLPEKTYQIVEVEQTAEQRQAYRELKEFGTTAIGGGHVTTTMVMQLLMKLHQINCGFVVDEERVLREVRETRTRDLLDLLQSAQGKVVIWAPFDFVIRKLRRVIGEEFGPESVAAFWGGNLRERGAEERRFLGEAACRFMVSTPQAGGIGNTWVAADTAIYYANDYDLEHRDQSEDRVHRMGQTARKVTIVDMMTRGTVDEKIVRALRKKIDMATAITREGHRAWLI